MLHISSTRIRREALARQKLYLPTWQNTSWLDFQAPASSEKALCENAM
jgi:hypothetical protein